MQFIVTFASSHQALAAERQFLGAGLPVELIPVPRQIRSDCGFCLLVQGAEGACERLRACGAQELWRVTATQAGPSSRKVYSYERYP